MAGYQYYPQAPGPKAPQNYPVGVGPNYMKWGEQPGWVYNPYTDKYTPDPNAIKQMQIQQGLREPDPSKPSLTETLVPVAAVGGTLIASQELGKEIPGLLKDVGGGLKDAVTGLFGGGPTAATEATQGFIGPPTPPGLGVEPTGFFSLGSEGLLGEGAMPVGNYIPGILGTVGAYDMFTNDYGTGRNLAQGAASGAGIGFTLGGPVGAGIGAGVGAGIGLIKSFFGTHETTRERQSKVTERLMKAAGDDPTAQSYVQAVRTQYASEPPDPDKPWFGGKYSSFDEYKKAGLDPDDLSHVEGNIDLYTPQVWANLTQEQRRAVTQANIADGIYDSKDGGVQITNKTKGRENFERIINGKGAAPASDEPTGLFADNAQTQQPVAQPVAKLTPEQIAAAGAGKGPAPVDPAQLQSMDLQEGVTGMFKPAPANGGVIIDPRTGQPIQVVPYSARTTTLSPGIGLNGQRISY